MIRVDEQKVERLFKTIRQIKKFVPTVGNRVIVSNVDVCPQIHIMRKSQIPINLVEAFKIGLVTKKANKDAIHEHLRQVLAGTDVSQYSFYKILKVAEGKMNPNEKEDFLELCGIKQNWCDDYIIVA